MAENLKDEITPQKRYATRKEFLKTMGVVGVSAAVLAACQDKPFIAGDDLPASGTAPEPSSSGLTDDLGDPLTSLMMSSVTTISTNSQLIKRELLNYPRIFSPLPGL